jgi:hypothetical protein
MKIECIEPHKHCIHRRPLLNGKVYCALPHAPKQEFQTDPDRAKEVNIICLEDPFAKEI